MKFKHLLLTRWNVGLYERNQKMRSGMRIVADVWMEHRWHLFWKYCAPSVKAQRCQDFEWLIVCDPKTPKMWPKRIADESGATILLGDNFRKTCVAEIEKRLTDEDRVITSRIDNDDALHKEYIHSVQAWVKRKQRTGVLTFPKGWIWNPDKEKLAHCRYVKNHFLTFVEKRGKKPVKTVLRRRHTDLTEKFKTFKVETRDHMWLEIIHGENMANHMRGQKVNINCLKMGEYGL